MESGKITSEINELKCQIDMLRCENKELKFNLQKCKGSKIQMISRNDAAILALNDECNKVYQIDIEQEWVGLVNDLMISQLDDSKTTFYVVLKDGDK